MLASILAISIALSAGGPWRFVLGKDNVKVWQREVDNGNIEFKGTVLIEQDIRTVFTSLYDRELRHKIIKHAPEHRIVEQPNPSTMILYTYYKSPFFLLDDRDQLVRISVVFDPEKQVIRVPFAGIEHPKEPPRNGVVRLPLTDGYWTVRFLGPEKTEVTYASEIDPGGWIPNWVGSYVAKWIPFSGLTKLRELTGTKVSMETLAQIETFDWNWVPEAQAAKPEVIAPKAMIH